MLTKFLLQMRQYIRVEQITRISQRENIRATAWAWIMAGNPDPATLDARAAEIEGAAQREYAADFSLGEPPEPVL